MSNEEKETKLGNSEQLIEQATEQPTQQTIEQPMVEEQHDTEHQDIAHVVDDSGTNTDTEESIPASNISFQIESSSGEFKKQSRLRVWKWILGILLLLIIIAGSWVYWITQPTSGHEEKTIKIPDGASTSQIASTLYNNGIIRNVLGFKLYLKYSGQADALQAGVYQLEQGQSLQDLVSILKDGDKSMGTVRFTIPEGFTIEQIAKELQTKGIVSANAFLQEADHGTFSSDLLNQIPNTSGIKHRLEGYLFPDTYEIFKGASAHDIIQKMLDRTAQVMTPQMIDDIHKRNMTLQQVMTIASMVEREAKVDKERPVIAGVIYNRLEKNPPMLLQIDATVEYAVGMKPELTEQDLRVNSPYNTYLHEGLPPGPIASPGILSLKAAVYPDHNPYYFYVVKNNGSGEHYFSKTYAEQLQNEQKSQQNAQQASHS